MYKFENHYALLSTLSTHTRTLTHTHTLTLTPTMGTYLRALTGVQIRYVAVQGLAHYENHKRYTQKILIFLLGF